MTKHYTSLGLILAGATLAACSMQPQKNAALDDARRDYAAAQGNPEVTKLAAVELQQAGKALDQANAAQDKHEDRAVVDHLAYLTKQRTAIAQATAKQKTADTAIANADVVRDKVRLEARTAEADAAKQKVAAQDQEAKLRAGELATANADIERGQRRFEAKTAETTAAAKRQAADSEAAASVAAAALATANADTERGKLRLEAQTAETAAAKQQATLAEENSTKKAAELDAAHAKLNQMETELHDLNAKKTERGLVITLGDVLFDVNKAELRSASSNSMQKLAAFFKEYPELKALIEGYTDNTGSSSHNQDLSDRRAMAVRNTLMNLGVSGDRVSTRGYGEVGPVASNDTSAGRQMNRRVEIVLSDDKGAIAPR